MGRWSEVLVKAATQEKQAGVGLEAAGTMLDPIGTIPFFAGLASDGSRRDVVDNARSSTSILPIAGSYRLGRRIGRTSDDFQQDRRAAGRGSKLYGEFLGGFGSTLAAGAAGAGIGAGIGRLTGDKNQASTLAGAGIGGGIGLGLSGLAQLLAYPASAITDRRDEQAQREYETGSGAANWLVPGMSNYNMMKRLGYSRAYDDEARDEEDKEYGVDKLQRQALMQSLQRIVDGTQHDLSNVDTEALRAATMLGVLKAQR